MNVFTYIIFKLLCFSNTVISKVILIPFNPLIYIRSKILPYVL